MRTYGVFVFVTMGIIGLSSEAKIPNVVFIIADDMVSCNIIILKLNSKLTHFVDH